MDTINEQVPDLQNQPKEQTKKGDFPIKTFLLIFVLILITIGLVILAIRPQQPPQEPTLQTQITPNPIQTVLTISSTPITQATPSSYITDVLINTGQNKVTSVQLELTYNPEFLTKIDIESGSFFVNPKVLLKNIDEKNGRITYAISSADNQGFIGQGIIAKISFKTLKKNLTTTIDFLPKTHVNAEGISESALKTSIGAVFTLGISPVATSSPTATKSAR